MAVLDGVKFYRISEIAEALAISRETVRGMCLDGTFPNARKVPLREREEWRVPEADVNSFLETDWHVSKEGE